MNPFQLSRNTTLLSDAVTEKAVELACERLRRDMEKTLTDIVKNRNRIILCKKDLRDRDRDPGDGLQRAFPWCVKYPRQQTGRHLQRRNGTVLCKYQRADAR